MKTLKLVGLTKRFGDKDILNRIDFEFHSPNRYIIHGQSGSGKTTLLNLIAGYDNPDRGHVEGEGSSNVGYLFQDEMLFSNLTVRENLFIKYASFSPNHHADSHFESLIGQTLRNFNILDLKERKVSMLSGGEKQRVQLASILISEPDIVLMDEPTSKLDKKNKEQIIKTIENVFKNKLIIVVSHESNLLLEGGMDLRLENGRLYHE
ncbi:putative ABC transport system ATP-binding protein [Paenibacillus algorifonticola]|uniref:Putative ABC transport system ATP-binding protein n=1 Tax=Paenibacillus algorifonticola TaxID=684063 RepID=A0A1I2CQD8_9BACL|nr:ATP-binding cassette domain-containing protein [Paenibacillus algorifonticola]SFE70003.1 putative ABC transport system ATP-binding protein [Paenibacillus algorifonticola]